MCSTLVFRETPCKESSGFRLELIGILQHNKIEPAELISAIAE